MRLDQAPDLLDPDGVGDEPLSIDQQRDVRAVHGDHRVMMAMQQCIQGIAKDEAFLQALV